eukprot:GHVR01188270.1.p1 GENE.GHVR01188270.1~~GHVR01188270.1.p1  ORF type:complete len:289 (-),score=31.01 GHVR01188270.1:9-875(-)
MDSSKIVKVAILGGAVLVLWFGIQKFAAPAPVVSEAAAPVVKQIEYIEVLMANANIPLGTRLTADHLSWKPWPKESLQPTLITNAETDRPDAIQELQGAIVRSEIFEGEPINEAKLVRAGDSGVMAAMLSPGMRAVTTRISVETAAGGFIQPGDRVDILITEKFNIRNNNASRQSSSAIVRDEINVSNIMFENVQVLAIDQTFATDPEGAAFVIGSTATFELSPSDATLLQEAQSSGEISLALRGLNASRTYAPSAAKRAVYEEDTQTPDLVVYRSGEPQRVAIRGQQ